MRWLLTPSAESPAEWPMATTSLTRTLSLPASKGHRPRPSLVTTRISGPGIQTPCDRQRIHSWNYLQRQHPREFTSTGGQHPPSLPTMAELSALQTKGLPLMTNSPIEWPPVVRSHPIGDRRDRLSKWVKTYCWLLPPIRACRAVQTNIVVRRTAHQAASLPLAKRGKERCA